MLSDKFQWLPSDVKVRDGNVTIESYINNLNPKEYGSLYHALEQIL
ncbi:hypothetical protein AKO1_005759, partial [Acrasis kona]